MRYTSHTPLSILLAALCAGLSACGGSTDAAPDNAMASATGTMAATRASTSYLPSSTAETTWTECAAEGGTCNVSGTAEVRYGYGSNFVVKTITGPVACSNAVFGDPAPGYGKFCSIASAPVIVLNPPPTTTITWNACATEGNWCTFSGTAEVRYGTATAYVTKMVASPVACANSVFGDPAPGQGKSCSVGSATQATPLVISPTPAPAPAPTLSPVVVQAGGITAVQLANPTAVTQTNAAATFGQVFAQGHVASGETVTGLSASGAAVPLQVDVKARHADGSLRHAVITAQLPSSAANDVQNITLVKATAAAAPAAATPASLLNDGFTAAFNATIGGVQYTASADALLKAGKYTSWLSGSLVNEWVVSAPLKTASGTEHPHLYAQFAIRSYAGSNSARVDVTLENGWAYQAAPQNLTYDAQMVVGGQAVYSQAALNHYHHARWRKVFWWGQKQVLNVRHNTDYLLASKALPNYDQSLAIKETTVVSWNTKWNASKNGPMSPALGMAYMPTTGARNDIGLMPTWSVLYLLTMDQRMKDITLGMSDAAGSWSAHYRDKNTGRPVTLASYPYLARNVSGATNPATQKSEALPDCPATLCTTPLVADTPHQPGFAYLPYLVTGDFYHLEELQFWANFNSFQIAPQYREAGKGLVMDNQVRGQAWTLRTVAEAAYITPDSDPQKASLTAIVNHNIDYFNNTYTNNAAANKLGFIANGYAIEYEGNTGLAPWQDDFMTSAIGHMVELGFTNAQPFLAWKSKFVVERLIGTGYCWIQGSAYNLKVRDSVNAQFYTTIGQAYLAANPTISQLSCASAAMASALQLRTGEMAGGASPIGQQGIIQPALAYAVGADANGAKAWAQFAARQFKPDYTQEPTYAILPR